MSLQHPRLHLSRLSLSLPISETAKKELQKEYTEQNAKSPKPLSLEAFISGLAIRGTWWSTNPMYKEHTFIPSL